MRKPNARIREKRRLFSALGVTLASLLIVVLCAGFVFVGNGIRSGSGLSAAVISSMLVNLANRDRSSNDLGELVVSPTLVAAAQAKANDMASKGYFAHTSPDGKDPWYWFKQANYPFSYAGYAGENLAIDFSDSADVERAWMDSPAHRANILNQHFTQIGIATAVGTYEGHRTTFVVQEFGTPAAVATTQPITNVTAPTKPTDIAIVTTQKPSPAPVTKPVSEVKAAASTSASAPAAVTPSPTPAPVPGKSGVLTQTWQTMFASPKTALQYAYYLLGVIILFALLLETGVELKRHHVRHVALALGLLLFMSGVFFAADHYFFTPPVIVEAGGPSSV
jgi:hypothetical protein